MGNWQKTWKKLENAYATAKLAKTKNQIEKSEKLKKRFFSYLENDFRTDKALGLLTENAGRFDAGFFDAAFFIFGLKY